MPSAAHPPVTPPPPASQRPGPASIPNFRDIGGLVTRHRARVRSGLLYRSVALDAASDEDLDALTGLGIRTVFDLRTGLEQTRRPDRVPPGARLVPLDLLVDSGEADPTVIFALMQDPRAASMKLSGGGTERFYIATYRDMVRLPSAREGYASLYRTLIDPAGRPALVHCTTGKDRTGWAVAALLLLLGVPEEDVLAEYLVSDAEIRRAYAHVIDEFVAAGGAREVIEPMLSVNPRFLGAALEAMHTDHGSIEAYFREGLGLGPAVVEALREAFLEPGEAGGGG